MTFPISTHEEAVRCNRWLGPSTDLRNLFLCRGIARQFPLAHQQTDDAVGEIVLRATTIVAPEAEKARRIGISKA
jgi:hypothetical protein